MFAFWRTIRGRRAIINLTTGRAVAGTVYAKRGPLIIIKAATIHDAGTTAPVDGDIVVERTRVDFVQLLPHD